MNKKIYSHDIKVTGIGKRNRIYAYSIRDQEVDLRGNGELTSFYQHQELICSGHWNIDNERIYCYCENCETNESLEGKDIILSSKDFNIYVLVKFEPEESES